MAHENKDKGFIAIYRSLQDNFIWSDKPFARGQAWIDLLLKANYEERSFYFNGNLETVGRGERITSLRQLAADWGWSKDKAKKFLDELKSFGMIDYFSDTKKTRYKVLNYGVYQDKREYKKDSKKTQTGNRKDTDRKQTGNRPEQTTINNNQETINNHQEQYNHHQEEAAQINPIPKASQVYFEEINAIAGRYEMEMLASYVTQFNIEEELLIRIIHIAVENKSPALSYIEAIVKRCKREGIQTLKQFEANETQRAREKETGKTYRENKKDRYSNDEDSISKLKKSGIKIDWAERAKRNDF